MEEKKGFKQRVVDRELEPSEMFSDRNGEVLLAVSELDAAENEFNSSPYVMLSMALRKAGKLYKSGSWGSVEGVMEAGTLAIALPNSQSIGSTPKAHMLGIAISQERANSILSDLGGIAALQPAITQLHNDPLCSSVLTALWRDAQVHGLSSMFFEHGLDLILRRLTSLNSKSVNSRPVRPLSTPQLKQAFDLIESRLDSDLRVDEIADLLGRETRGLTRAFKDATGYAPYEYLTYRRMEHAKELLTTDQTILSIANAVGYMNPAKFSAAFRRFYGCPPSTWRKRFT